MKRSCWGHFLDLSTGNRTKRIITDFAGVLNTRAEGLERRRTRTQKDWNELHKNVMRISRFGLSVNSSYFPGDFILQDGEYTWQLYRGCQTTSRGHGGW